MPSPSCLRSATARSSNASHTTSSPALLADQPQSTMFTSYDFRLKQLMHRLVTFDLIQSSSGCSASGGSAHGMENCAALYPTLPYRYNPPSAAEYHGAVQLVPGNAVNNSMQAWWRQPCRRTCLFWATQFRSTRSMDCTTSLPLTIENSSSCPQRIKSLKS